MLNLKIEKEVETKHTVIRGKNWDVRQTACILTMVIIVCIFWWIGDLDATGIALVSIPFGCIAYLCGWKEEAGLKIEDLLIKYVQKTMYKNERRGYHTRNGYVDLINGAYSKMKDQDMKDKKAVRLMRSKKKQDKARKKVSKYRAYV